MKLAVGKGRKENQNTKMNYLFIAKSNGEQHIIRTFEDKNLAIKHLEIHCKRMVDEGFTIKEYEPRIPYYEFHQDCILAISQGFATNVHVL